MSRNHEPYHGKSSFGIILSTGYTQKTAAKTVTNVYIDSKRLVILLKEQPPTDYAFITSHNKWKRYLVRIKRMLFSQLQNCHYIKRQNKVPNTTTFARQHETLQRQSQTKTRTPSWLPLRPVLSRWHIKMQSLTNHICYMKHARIILSGWRPHKARRPTAPGDLYTVCHERRSYRRRPAMVTHPDHKKEKVSK